MIYIIYKLINTFGNQVFYIGRTKDSLIVRLNGHISTAKSIVNNKNENSILPVSRYIKTMLDLDIEIKIEEITRTNDKQEENRQIDIYSKTYWLYNSSIYKKRMKERCK